MDPGGYVPRYEALEPTDEAVDGLLGIELVPPVAPGRWKRRLLWIGSGAFIGIALASAGWMAQRQSSEIIAPSSANAPAVRTGLREHTVPTLQAADVAAEARALYFPVFDARRQLIALDMYEYAIELAPDLPDGYAGAAQVSATLHMITPDNEQRKA